MNTIWILLIIAFIIYELITMNIIAIFYAIGIILSLSLVRLTPIPDNYILEIFLTIFLGSILLFFFRKKFILYLKKKNIILNDDLIGKKVKVTKDFNNQKGIIIINNKKYTVSTKDSIKKNDKIEIIDILHNKMIVRKIK